MIVYVYSKCSTCKAAIQFLKARQIAFTQIEITETPPSISELKTMLGFYGAITKLFNTSGELYREMQLSKKLPEMDQKDALKLLSQHGMLVKRPFLLGKDYGLLGFKEPEWEAKI